MKTAERMSNLAKGHSGPQTASLGLKGLREEIVPSSTLCDRFNVSGGEPGTIYE